MTAAFTAMVRGPADLHLLFADLPRADRCADDDWIARDRRRSPVPVPRTRRPRCARGGDGREPDRRAGGRVGPARAGGARAARRRDGGDRGRGLRRAGVGGRRPPARRRAAGRSRRPTGARRPCSTRPRASGCCAATGCRCPTGRCARARAPRSSRPPISAGPVAVKALGAAHKTDQHAVRLGLVDPADVRAAAAELLARFPAVLVERLVVRGVAELLVGVQTDPVFGPVLSLGVGGVLTELVRDVAPPAAARRARPRSGAPCWACAALRCSPATAGAPSADLDRLVAVVDAGGRARARHAGAGRAGDQPVDRHRRRGPGPATRWSSPAGGGA